MVKANKQWRSGILVVAVALIVVACGGGDDAATADSNRTITIELSDFEISPSNITAKVGDTVTIKMTNTGALHHHWMMGREVDTDSGFAGTFHQNFFTDDTSPEVTPMNANATDMGIGFQIQRDPGLEATIRFTITADQVGEWEMACFVDDGAHYEAGMKGTFTVEP